jgi:HAD superfamily hydrolase (TIGR01509 family)
MKLPQVMIFDVDGTLLDTEFIWQREWERAGRRYGVFGFSRVFNEIVGLNHQPVAAIAARHYPDLDAGLIETILRQAGEEGFAAVNRECRPMPGAVEMIAFLRRQGVRLAVATSTRRKPSELRLKKNGLWDCFECVVCGDEVARAKPDPEIYQTVLGKMGCTPEAALVAEDTGLGVQAAAAAGIPVIMIPSLNPPRPQDRAAAAAVVKDMDQARRLLEQG